MILIGLSVRRGLVHEKPGLTGQGIVIGDDDAAFSYVTRSPCWKLKHPKSLKAPTA